MDGPLKALLLLCGAGLDARPWTALKQLGLPPDFLWCGGASVMQLLPLGEKGSERIRALEAADWAEKEYEACLKSNVRLVLHGSDDYPQALYELPQPPALLYWQGAAKTLSGRTVGVVGTRRNTPYGREVAFSIGGECALRHTAVVSGGALGIDGASHAGAIEAGGVTFAVFGTGIDVVFPSEHGLLFEKIRENGAVMTEFPLGAQGEAWHFPRRNRIVAALSQKLVVVEAPIKSGAMITARLALDLGREVWAVPGRMGDKVSEGANRLIFDGAYPFISMESFFGTQPGQGSLFAEGAKIAAPKAADFPPDEAAVMSALWNCGGKTVDNIALEVKMSAADVLKTIAVLSAKGAVYSSGPGRYSAKV